MSLLWTLPLAAQGLLMGTDELWFHRRRGLPRWERIGHPIDTASVLLCLLVPGLAAPSPASVAAYGALALLSCALVTKDEPVHSARCSPGEHWIHAALFVLHPVVFAVSALLWSARDGQPLAAAVAAWSGLALPEPALAAALLRAQLVAVAGFGAYQLLYWNRRPA
jgi:hypothetical protein